MVLYRAFERFGGAPDHVELQLVRAIEADLGSGDRFRQVRQLMRERMAGIGNDLHEAAGGIEGVVEAVVAVAEEHVAAHFAGQFRVRLLHLGFDEGMAGLPHDGVAAARGEIVVHGCEHFTSPMNVAPGLRVRISRA